MPSSSTNAPPLKQPSSPLPGPDRVGMMPPVNQVAAGDVAPAETRSVAVVEIHQVIASVVVERAVRVAGHAHVLRHAEMVSRTIGIGEEPLAQQPRRANRFIGNGAGEATKSSEWDWTSLRRRPNQSSTRCYLVGLGSRVRTKQRAVCL